MQKKMHDEDVNVSSVFTEHHKKEKFRESNKDLKFTKTRNALGRHIYRNQVRSFKLKIISILQLFSKFTIYVIYEIVLNYIYKCFYKAFVYSF